MVGSRVKGSEHVAGERRGKRIPFVLAGCDLRALPLSPLEAFVFSRIDGSTTEEDLIAVTGLESLAVTVALDRLASFGALRFAEPAFKRSVSQTHTRAVMPDGTPSRPTVRYPEASRRSAFVTKSPNGANSSPSQTELSAVPVPRTSVNPTGSIGPARSLTPVPTGHRPSTMRPDCELQMSRYLDGARIALEEGNALAAANYYRLAQQIAPNDPDIRRALDACAAASAESRLLAHRAAKLAIAGDNAARAKEWEVAATAYKEAAELAPRDPVVLYKAAGALYRSGGNLGDAAQFAEASVRLVSNRIETWILLGQIYLEAGARASAILAAEKARKLRSDDERVVRLFAKLGISH